MFPKPTRPRKVVQSRSERQAVYDAVLARDRDCRAPVIDPASSPCAGRLHREHVRPGGGAMGAPRVTRRDTVLILCERHHLGGWATSHKAEEREYLRRIEG